MKRRCDPGMPPRDVSIVSGPLVSVQFRNCERLQQAASTGPPLSIGSRGDAVRILQAVLHAQGYDLRNSMRTGHPDGDYQREMANAVRTYQRRYGHDVDGMAGREVLLHLDRALVRAGGSLAARLPASLRQRVVAAPSSTAVARPRPPMHGQRVVADSGDRALQRPAPTDVVLPASLTPIPRHPIFAKVYEEATAQLRLLCTESRRVLAAFGCGTDLRRARFDAAMGRVLEEIAASNTRRGPIDRLTSSSGDDKRRELIREVVRSFGGTEQQATSVAERVLGTFAGRQTPGLQLTNLPTNTEVMTSLFRSGCRLHARLGELRRGLSAPYRGTPRDSGPGVEQALDLLQRFPDLATSIYAAAELPGLEGFPPRVVATTNLRGRDFSTIAREWAERRRPAEGLRAAGLVIAGVALAIISFGTLSALSATLVSCGIGVATAAANVGVRAADYRSTRDAYAIGAASPESLALSQARLRGAWAQLVVDAVTIGTLTRMGGAANGSRLARLVRIELVGGAGTALSTACDPNVIGSPNAAGIILFATAIGVTSDATGDAAVSRLVSRARSGGSLQIAVVPTTSAPLRPGSALLVADGPDAPPLRATLHSEDRRQSTLALRLEDGTEIRTRVDRAGRIDLPQGASPNDLAVGTALTVADVGAYGIDPALARSMLRYAAENDINIRLRGGSAASMEHRLTAGAHPKPYGMEAKSINEIDVQLGIGRPQDIGLIAHARPTPRPGEAGWEGLNAAQRARARERLQNYEADDPQMQSLMDTGGWRRVGRNRKERYRIRIDEHGVVRDLGGTPFASDIDVFTITHADGTALGRSARVQHTRALQEMSGAAVQHSGFTPDWNPTSPRQIRARQTMLESYGPRGSRNLLDITPRGFFTGRGPDPATLQ